MSVSVERTVNIVLEISPGFQKFHEVRRRSSSADRILPSSAFLSFQASSLLIDGVPSHWGGKPALLSLADLFGKHAHRNDV